MQVVNLMRNGSSDPMFPLAGVIDANLLGSIADQRTASTRFLSEDPGCKFQFNLIDVTPSPAFPWFEGPHDRVTRVVEVFPRMLVFG